MCLVEFGFLAVNKGGSRAESWGRREPNVASAPIINQTDKFIESKGRKQK